MIYSVLNNEIVISAIAVGLAGLIAWGFTMLQMFLNSKIKDVKLREAMNRLTEIVQNAVMSINQTFVDQLKKDGKFDKANQAIALNKSLEAAKAMISLESKKFIEANYGPLDTLLVTMIEAMINRISTYRIQ